MIDIVIDPKDNMFYLKKGDKLISGPSLFGLEVDIHGEDRGVSAVFQNRVPAKLVLQYLLNVSDLEGVSDADQIEVRFKLPAKWNIDKKLFERETPSEPT